MSSSSLTTVLLMALATIATVSSSIVLEKFLVETCANNGTMVNGKCECDLPWIGETCEEKRCMNGGYASRFRDTIRCSCIGGVNGKRCEVVEDCLNGGKLINKSLCECAPGFEGVRCQYNPPCNSGKRTPIPGTDNFTCTCSVFTTGPTCKEFVKFRDCKNGIIVPSRNECRCFCGWVGEECEVENFGRTVCDSDGFSLKEVHCSKEHSVLHEGKCECDCGWTGTACNESVGEQGGCGIPESSPLISELAQPVNNFNDIVIISFLVLLVLILIGCIFRTFVRGFSGYRKHLIVDNDEKAARLLIHNDEKTAQPFFNFI